MLILLWILCSSIFTKSKCHVLPFNKHTDLQKVGELTFKNEKYNVLKVVTHSIRDHFEDFMRQSKVEFPTKKLFLDKNGMRHYWNDFEIKENYIQVTKIVDNPKSAVQIYEIDDDQTDVFKQVGLAELLANTYKPNTLKVTTKRTISDVSTVSTNLEIIGLKPIAREDPPTTPTPEKKGSYLQATFFCPFLGMINYLIPEEPPKPNPSPNPK